MTETKFKLDERNNVVPCADVLEWAEFFEKQPNRRRVARTKLGDVLVSTVFLGLDHNFDDGPPLIFETMVFGGDLDQKTYRYSTWDEAVKGHEAMVRRVTERIKRKMKHGKRNDGSGTGCLGGPFPSTETNCGADEPDRQESCSCSVGEVLRQTSRVSS